MKENGKKDYRAAFDRALTSALRNASTHLPWPEVLERGSKLQGKRREHQTLLLSNTNRFSRPEVVSDLVARSFAARHTDAAETRRLAVLAVEVAETLEADGPERPLVADARAEALAALANAERINGNLQAGESLWQKVDALLFEGSGNPSLIADCAWLRGTLRVEQKRYPLAIRDLGYAVETYRSCGESHKAGRTMIGLARAHRGAGDLSQAIDCLSEAGRHIDFQEEPSLQIMVAHNLAWYLDEAGFPLHAFRVLSERRFTPTNRKQRLMVLRSRWLEAQIAGSLGVPAQASAILISVLKGFLEEDLPFDAALAALELALFYVKQGKHAEARALAREVHPIFQAGEVPLEANMAMLVYVQACADETLTLEGLLALQDRLRAEKAAAPQRD